MKAFTKTKYGGPEVLQLEEVKENVHQHKGKYDLIIDINGNLKHEDLKRM